MFLEQDNAAVLLIQNGANVSAVNTGGHNALTLAALNGEKFITNIVSYGTIRACPSTFGALKFILMQSLLIPFEKSLQICNVCISLKKRQRSYFTRN